MPHAPPGGRRFRLTPHLIILPALLFVGAIRGEAQPDTVYVVQHGWHPGILIPMPHAEPLMLGPLDGEDADFVDVGWGDAGYYPDPDPGLWTLLRAALWPTPGIIQIVPVTEEVERFSPLGPIVAVAMADSLIEAVVEYVLDELDIDDDSAQSAAPSLYGDGYFFDATRRYHVFNNSNQWAARALAAGGCELSVWQTLTVEILFQQVKDCGEVIREVSD